MARYFSLSSKYLESSTTPVTGPPMTLNIWFNLDTLVGGGQTIFSIGDASSSQNYAELFVSGSSYKLIWWVKDISGYKYAITSSTATAGVWQMATGREFASNDRQVDLNGGADYGENTDSKTLTGLDRFRIGKSAQSTGAFPAKGAFCYATIWDVGLTDEEVADLYGDGVPTPPDRVRPSAIQCTYPLFDGDNDKDWWGSYDLSAIGSPTYVERPPEASLMVPAWKGIAAGAAPTFEPAWARHANQLIG